MTDFGDLGLSSLMCMLAIKDHSYYLVDEKERLCAPPAVLRRGARSIRFHSLTPTSLGYESSVRKITSANAESRSPQALGTESDVGPDIKVSGVIDQFRGFRR